MQKYFRNQEKRNFNVAIIEAFDEKSEAEFVASKRDERQACTSFHESFKKFIHFMNGYEENIGFWFSRWQEATLVSCSKNKDASAHTCNCYGCIDSH